MKNICWTDEERRDNKATKMAGGEDQYGLVNVLLKRKGGGNLPSYFISKFWQIQF